MGKERIATGRSAPRNDKTIKVIEYVHTADGGLVRVDQLEPEQYEKFRQWLGCTYLNELYRGQAEFYYPEAQGTGRTDPSTSLRFAQDDESSIIRRRQGTGRTDPSTSLRFAQDDERGGEKRNG